MTKTNEADYYITKEYGSVRHNYMISQDLVNKKLEEFTMTPRLFTAYPADRIETVLRHYNVIPKNAYYQGFDTTTNCVRFVVNEMAHGQPRWIREPEWWKKFKKRVFG